MLLAEGINKGLSMDDIANVNIVDCSVADPGCLSRIPDPEFYPSRIPDPKTVTKERDEKKFDILFCSHKISQN